MHTGIKKRIIFLGFFVYTIFLCGCQEETVFYTQEESSEAEVVTIQSELTVDSYAHEDENSGSILVYVCGQVVNPGVYALEKDARVYQAIEAAGGFLPEADSLALNQAEKLYDGQKLYVPAFGEEIKTEETKAEDGLININTASVEQLTTLPGIGLAKAESIIAYREANGSFETIEEIMKVEGIKEGVYNKIKDFIKAD